MKNRTREDISAYLDGEAKDPQSIARLIAESKDASQEHLAFAELSARIRSLDEPDIHPAFAARIVATIEEQRARRRSAWRIPTAIAAAALMLLVATVSINTSGTTPRTPADNIAALPSPTPVLADNEAGLLAELERRVAQDTHVQQFVVARFDNAPETADLYSDRLLSAIAHSDGAAAAGLAFAHGVDYRTEVQRMNGDQTAALKQLLNESVMEALEG